jgi:membrane protein implicated in regulation of membrane protease activity
MSPRVQQLTTRLEQLAARMRRPSSRRVQVVVFAGATIIFAVGASLAVRNFPDTHRHPNYALLVLDVALGPLAVVLLNGVEFGLIARLLAQRVTVRRALRISVLGTVANQLPVPGAVIVRTQALAAAGSGYRRALMGNLSVGLAWMGSAFLMAGVLQLGGRVPLVGAACAFCGVALLFACRRVVKRTLRTQSPRYMTLRIIACETALVLVQGTRLFVVLHGFGESVSPAQAVALALSSVLSTAVGVAPGGFGVREAIAAGIGPVVGLPASASLVAIAFDRVADLAVVGIAALVIFAASRHTARRDGQLTEPAELPTDGCETR